MALESHIEFLKKKHARLDQMVREATIHPGIDDLVLRHLKSEKLNVKDDIERLLHHGNSAAA